MQNLLDAVVDYLPSPLEVPPVQGTDLDDTEKIVERKADDKEPFSALVFKIMTDPFVGQLASSASTRAVWTRAISVYNVAKGRKERIGRLVKMHANKREEITGSAGGRHLRRGGSEDRFRPATRSATKRIR